MTPYSNGRLRDHFLGWQCRLRQHCMRFDGGRPASGMRPRFSRADGGLLSDGVTTLLIPAQTIEHIAFFKFQTQRTNDPRQRYEKGLQYLQGTYYQIPGEFTDELTALFPPASQLAKTLLAEAEILAEFAQANQTYRMACTVRKLPARDPARDLTLWHNRLFNPDLPAASIVIGLQPQWRSAQAHPVP